jgi:hypothetical protein
MIWLPFLPGRFEHSSYFRHPLETDTILTAPIMPQVSTSIPTAIRLRPVYDTRSLVYCLPLWNPHVRHHAGSARSLRAASCARIKETAPAISLITCDESGTVSSPPERTLRILTSLLRPLGSSPGVLPRMQCTRRTLHPQRDCQQSLLPTSATGMSSRSVALTAMHSKAHDAPAA